MSSRHLVVYVVVAAVVLATAAVLAVAQTDRGDQSAGVQIAQAAPPAGGARPGGAARPDFAAMLRERLTAAGATEADIQAIEAHRAKQREIMQPLQDAMGALREAAGAGATDAQAKAAVTKYEAAMKTALDALAKAEADLKAKLNLAAKPKLHAALLTMGTLDNGMRGGMGMRGAPGAFGGARGGGAGGGARGGARGGGAAP
jgi:hypothetical protein